MRRPHQAQPLECKFAHGSGIAAGERHKHDDLPVLLAGHGGGSVRQGRLVQAPADHPSVIVGDPRLAPLGLYGGPTPTMLPLADSPAMADDGHQSSDLSRPC